MRYVPTAAAMVRTSRRTWIVATLTVAHSPGLAAGGKFTCHSQTDVLLEGSTFIHDICCLQQGELCPESAIFPTTCQSDECARAVALVHGACTPWLSEVGQAFLGNFKTDLDRAAAMCKLPSMESLDETTEVCGTTLIQLCADAKLDATPHGATPCLQCAGAHSAALAAAGCQYRDIDSYCGVPVPNYLAGADNGALLLSAVAPVLGDEACGSVLVDGRNDDPGTNNGLATKNSLRVTSQSGLRPTVRFDSFFMPDGDVVSIYDGPSQSSPLLASLGSGDATTAVDQPGGYHGALPG